MSDRPPPPDGAPPSGPGVRIATIPASHAAELREALAAAGIEAHVVDVVPMTQVEAVRLNYRPMADVIVQADRESDARAIVDRVQREGEAAAEEQAEQPTDGERAATESAAPEASEGARIPLLQAALLGFVALVLVSLMVFGFDRIAEWASTRFPYAFPIAALVLFAAIFFALRRPRRD